MVQIKRFLYKQIPQGPIKPGQDVATDTIDFDPTQSPPEGGLVVKVLFLSLDPYMRGRMRPTHIKSYTPAYEPGQALNMHGVAQVLASASPKAKKGDLVASIVMAQEYAVLPKQVVDLFGFLVLPRDTPHPLSYYCGVLGMPGRTAYSSLYEIGAPKKGETIWVSAAAGPVGQIVGQLAKHEGLKVIGSVGDDKKLDCITKEMGFDAGFNYKKEKPADALKRLAPDGVDIYYDNVGGEQLETALNVMNNNGRIVACGQVSQYNLTGDERYPIRNTMLIVSKRLLWRGFIQGDPDFGPKYNDEFLKNTSAWLADGTFKAVEEVTDGIDGAPDALVGLLAGKNFGKVIVKVGEQDQL